MFNGKCIEGVSEVCLQFVSSPHTARGRVTHDNVVGYEGGEPFNISGPDSVEPRLSDSIDRRRSGIAIWFWNGAHDYLLLSARSMRPSMLVAQTRCSAIRTAPPSVEVHLPIHHV